MCVLVCSESGAMNLYGNTNKLHACAKISESVICYKIICTSVTIVRSFYIKFDMRDSEL